LKKVRSEIMDPVTLIVTAIVAGAAAAAKPTAEQAVKDGYAGLRTLIRRKFANQGEVKDALEQVEKKPAEAGGHDDLVQAAEALLALLQPQGADQSQTATATGGSAAATGWGAAAVGEGNIQITGDVEGGVNVGLPPRD
jgi:hypothetical protein